MNCSQVTCVSGGIHFTKLNPSSGELEYKLFMQNRQDSRWSLEEFWPEDGPYSSVADQNDIPGSPQYWQSGFLSIQFAINSIFLKVVGTLGCARKCYLVAKYVGGLRLLPAKDADAEDSKQQRRRFSEADTLLLDGHGDAGHDVHRQEHRRGERSRNQGWHGMDIEEYARAFRRT